MVGRDWNARELENGWNWILRAAGYWAYVLAILRIQSPSVFFIENCLYRFLFSFSFSFSWSCMLLNITVLIIEFSLALCFKVMYKMILLDMYLKYGQYFPCVWCRKFLFCRHKIHDCQFIFLNKLFFYEWKEGGSDHMWLTS